METASTAIQPSNLPNSNTHVRAPELKRNGTRVVMLLALFVGALAGARILWSGFSDSALGAVAESMGGTFFLRFARQLGLCAVMLAGEFVLGFFAFGDLLVWTAPYICAAGGVLRIAAGSATAIPSAVICAAAVTAGAAYSAEMSGMLLKLSQGNTVYMGNSPLKKYAGEFLICFVIAVAGSIIQLR